MRTRKLSPFAGTAECSPGRQSWVEFERKKSPAGTAEKYRELGYFPGQLSAVPAGLFGLSYTDPGLSSWATFSRPCGTEFGNLGVRTYTKGHTLTSPSFSAACNYCTFTNEFPR